MRNNHVSFARYILSLLVFVSFNVFAVPEIQTWKSSNGARVLFVRTTDLPMLDVRVVFDAGSARDNGVPGVAALTNGLLAEGAGSKTAQQLAESFDSVGAQFDNASLRDMAYVGVRTLTDEQYLQTAIESLTTVLSQPDFPEQAFERELSRMKVALQSRKQSPAEIAEEAYYKALYSDHPYATPPGGSEDSLQKIKLDDVTQFYRQFYVASNAVIAMVGNIDRLQAEKIVDSLISGIQAGDKMPALPEVQPLEKEQTIHIEFPSAQSHIFIGQPGIWRGDADYFPLYVANHSFGGSGFASRLVEVIREERGLAYSVYSYFNPMRVAGPFTMGMQTRADQTQEAIDLLRAELKRYIEEGPEDEEIESSISNITGSFALNLDSNGKLLGYLAMLGFYDLPVTYLDEFIDNVKNVDDDAIDDALERRLHPDKMVTVIVGNDGQ